MKESLRRYLQQQEEAQAFLREESTPENIESALAEYETANEALEKYKDENPEKWQEFYDLERKYFSHAESWTQLDYENEIRPIQEAYQNHSAWLLASRETEAMIRYYSLVKAAEEK